MIEKTDMNTVSNGELKQASKLTIAISLVFTLLNIIVAPALMGAGFDPQRWGEFAGILIGPVILGLLVVAFFQLFKKFRNQRSRWKIYCWTLVIMLISNLARLAQMVVPPSNL